MNMPEVPFNVANCWDCGEPLPDREEDIVIATYAGDFRWFCSRKCHDHWRDDSQEGAALTEILLCGHLTGPYKCIRPVGHSGRHEAATGAVWRAYE